MLSIICSAKQKSLQMCAELRHCQRWVTNRERKRVPQWRTRDGKTSLSVSRRSWSRYRQIAACCRSGMTSDSGGRNLRSGNEVAKMSIERCYHVKTLGKLFTHHVAQALLQLRLYANSDLTLWPLDTRLGSQISNKLARHVGPDSSAAERKSKI